MDIIAYPLSDFQINKRNAVKLMRLLELNKEHIKSREDCKKNWSQVLSGGEKQKIMVVGAIVKLPKLLIMDETTSNLDKYSSNIVFELIRTNLVKTYGTTVIYTSHVDILYHDITVTLKDQHLNFQDVDVVGEVNEFF